jgi:hypothetical protein
MLRGFGKDFADFDAAFPVWLKLKRRRQDGTQGALGCEVPGRNCFIGPFGQGRFGIERIHMRRSAVQVNVDDALCASGQRRWPGCQRVLGGGAGIWNKQAGIAQESGESQNSESGSHLPEHLSPGQQPGWEMFGNVHINRQKMPRLK